MDAVEWDRCAGAGRIDLGAVALELRLGARHPGGGESADDRHNATDVWTIRPQAGQRGDRLTLRKSRASRVRAQARFSLFGTDRRTPCCPVIPGSAIGQVPRPIARGRRSVTQEADLASGEIDCFWGSRLDEFFLGGLAA